MTEHSPRPSPIEPDPIEPADEQLSALVDGELPADELAELEELAVARDVTISDLTEPFNHVRSELAATLQAPAPSELRSGHLAAALDAMDAPEVASLAAARAGRRTTDRSDAAGPRLGQLTAIAAVVALVAGIGFIGLRTGGTTDAETAATATEDSGASTTGAAAAPASSDGDAMMEESNASPESAGTTGGNDLDDAASADDSAMDVAEAIDDDGAMAEDDAMAADGDMEDDAMEEGDGAETAERTAVTIDGDVDLTSARFQDIQPSEDTAEAFRTARAKGEEPECLFEAEAQVEDNLIESAILIEQDGVTYELVLLANDELLVFELPGCLSIE